MSTRICMITSWFPSKENPHIAPFVYSFAKELVRYGENVTVITLLKKGDEAFVNDAGLHIYRVKGLLSILSVYNLLSTINPDILHVQAPNYFSSISLILGWLKKLPVIATVHRAEIDSINKFLSIIRKITLSKYDHIIAVSMYSKMLALKAGAKENRISVIYNSCNESLFMPGPKMSSRTKCKLPSDKKIILFVGNLVKIKGVYTLMNALCLLKKKIEFHAVIIGKGEEEGNMKIFVNDNNMKDLISFIGWLPQRELPEFYKAADVFVLPSFVEGHSVALLESMACGTPVIASEIGGNIESISNGINGFLIPVGDHYRLASKLEKLLKDDSLLDSFSKNSVETYSKKFSNKKQIEEYLKIYKGFLYKNDGK